MVGDWVQWKDKYVQIAAISGIVYSFGHIDVELAHCGSGFIERHDLKSISPIPLTLEILGLNGFECIESKGEIAPKRGDFKMDNRWCEEGFSWNGIAVVYVHQLQHALRLCGLHELANNFKVE